MQLDQHKTQMARSLTEKHAQLLFDNHEKSTYFNTCEYMQLLAKANIPLSLDNLKFYFYWHKLMSNAP
jgi:hypothetical protein